MYLIRPAALCSFHKYLGLTNLSAVDTMPWQVFHVLAVSFGSLWQISAKAAPPAQLRRLTIEITDINFVLNYPEGLTKNEHSRDWKMLLLHAHSVLSWQDEWAGTELSRLWWFLSTATVMISPAAGSSACTGCPAGTFNGSFGVYKPVHVYAEHMPFESCNKAYEIFHEFDIQYTLFDP